MKIIVFFIVILTLIIGAGIYFQNMLINESQGMIQDLDEIVSHIRKDNWEDAKTLWDQMDEQWHRNRRKWQSLTDHQEIGAIDESLARLGVLLSMRDGDCLPEIAALRQNIIYIPDKEKLTWSNIF